VTRNVLDPNWLMPPLVFITSPLLHRLSAEAKADLKLAGHTIKQAEQPTASCEEQASAARSGHRASATRDGFSVPSSANRHKLMAPSVAEAE